MLYIHQILMFYSTNNRIIGANLLCSLSLGTRKVTAVWLRMRINGKRYAILFFCVFRPLVHAYQRDGLNVSCSCENAHLLRKAPAWTYLDI